MVFWKKDIKQYVGRVPTGGTIVPTWGSYRFHQGELSLHGAYLMADWSISKGEGGPCRGELERRKGEVDGDSGDSGYSAPFASRTRMYISNVRAYK